jgi:mannosyl-3-phosphoglycerate phosphatase
MYGALETVGIGDSLNDIPFLLVVDRPVLVRRLPGGQEKQMRIPALVRTAADGPAGWNEAVLTILGAGSTQPPD